MLLLLAVSGLLSVSSAWLALEERTTIAKKFYEQRKVGAVTAFICWDNHEREFLLAMSAVGIAASIARGNSPTDVIKARKCDNFYRSGVFVDFSCPDTLHFLEAASRQKLFTILHHWLILEDTRSFKRAQDSNTTLLDSDEDHEYLDSKEGVLDSKEGFLDSKEGVLDSEEGFFEEGSGLTKKSAEFLHPAPQLSKRTRALLGDVQMLPDSKVTWCQRANASADIDTLLCLEIYKPCIGYPLEASLVGEISVGGDTKMRLLETHDATARRGDLKGASLKAATVIQFPQRFTSMSDLNTKYWDLWTKIHDPIARNLANQLNFSLDVTTLFSYGWHLPNGSFDGLMGMLQRKEIELTATGIFMRLDRLEHVDFVADTYMARAAILFRQPSLSTVHNIFLLPFSGGVWLSCASLCAITFLVLATQIFYSAARCPDAGKDCSEEASKEHITAWDVGTYVFCIVCQQGFHTVPHALSARITVFVVSLASLFLFTSFSANIVALLQTPSVAIRSLVDLMDSPLKLLVEDIAYNKHYLEESTDEVTQQLIRRKLSGSDSYYLNAYEGMQCIRTGMIAFQIDTAVGYKIISDTYTEPEKCGLMEVEMFPLPRFAMATARGSSYRELLGQRLRWQREAGILHRLKKMWVTQKPICENNLVGFVSVSLIEFYPALAVLYYGFVASLLIFFGEILHFHRMTLLRLFVKPRRQRRRRRRENEMKRAFNKVAAVPIESSGVGVGVGVDVDRARLPPAPPWAWMD